MDYIDTLREAALDSFRHNQLLYVAGGLKESPAIPTLLKDEKAGE